MKLAVSLGIVALACGLHAQTRPQFEVASIKHNDNCRNGGSERMPTPGHLRMDCISLHDVIQVAYGFLADGVAFNRSQVEIAGLPGWAESDRFDVEAKAEKGDAPVALMGGPMLQGLLEERFRLKIHKESKEVATFVLTVGKNGPKMAPMKEGSCVPLDLDHLPQPKHGEPMPNLCGNIRMQGGPKGMKLDGSGMTVTEFAQSLSMQLQRPVVDKTGLTGKYDFHIEMPRDETNNSAPFGPDIILAGIQEQLGLKVGFEKGSSQRLVVDSVEKLAEN